MSATRCETVAIALLRKSDTLARVGGDEFVALIADLNTSWAMYALVGLRRSVKWRDSYLAYVEIAHRWAAENSWSADEIEWAAFRCWANTKGRPVLKQRLTISD